MTGGEDRGVIVMMVQQVMTREVLTIGPDTPCDKAGRFMDEHRIRHLPVVADGRCVGMVSDRDVRSAAVQPGAIAGRIMTPDPLAVSPETRVEDAAQLMLDARIGSLLVADGPTLVGILTYTDLLRAFVRVIETATQERIAVDLGEDR